MTNKEYLKKYYLENKDKIISTPITPNIECHSYHTDPPPMLRRGYSWPVLLLCRK